MRYHWLFKISQALHRSGELELRSVPELRSACPEISAQYPKMGLVELEEIHGLIVAGHQFPLLPQKRRRGEPKTPQMRKSKLSDAEILRMRSAGATLREIGLEADVSPEAIRQRLKSMD